MTYTKRKSTLSLTTVSLLPVMRFAFPPPPGGGLSRGFMVPSERMRNVNTTLTNDDDLFFSAHRKSAKRNTAGSACLAARHGKGEIIVES